MLVLRGAAVAASSDPVSQMCAVPGGGGTPLWEGAGHTPCLLEGWWGEGAEPGPRLAQPLLCPPRPQARAAAPEQLLVYEAKGLEEGVRSAPRAALGKPFPSFSCPAASQSHDVLGLGGQCRGVALTPHRAPRNSALAQLPV